MTASTHRARTLFVRCIATAALAGTAAVVIAAPDVYLDDFATDDRIYFRELGVTNYLESDPVFEPFGVGMGSYRMPYGDRIAYDSAGLFDVDGDGYNDWATTWYFAEPVSGLDHTNRMPDDAAVIPDDRYELTGTLEAVGGLATDVATVRGLSPAEFVGFVRIFSGKDNSQIGPEIWGYAHKTKLAHEIAAIPDIDGDGRAEVILGTNTTEGNKGCVLVYSYTNAYNTDGGTDDRWVCIWQIVGEHTGAELGYEIEDMLVDLNGDGRVDIVTGTKWWRDSPSDGRDLKTGAAWVFLTPEEDVFTDVLRSAAWPADGVRGVKRPLGMTTADYSLRATKTTTGDAALGEIEQAGDLDGDGHTDFVANAGYTGIIDGVQDSVGGLYFFLSYNGLDHQATTKQIANATPKYVAGPGDELAEHPLYASTRIDLTLEDADCLIHGTSDRGFGLNHAVSSIVGVELDDDPNDPTNTDMAIISMRDLGSGPVAPGIVHILLDNQTRFQAGSRMRQEIDASLGAVDPGPMKYTWRHLEGDELPPAPTGLSASPDPHPIEQDYKLSGASGVGFNVNGVSLAGNFDGEGFQDCELSVTSVATLLVNDPSCSVDPYQGVSSVMIFDIFTPSAATAPERLLWVRNETRQFCRAPKQGPPVDFTASAGRPNAKGLVTEPGWDMDGDGRDDLVLRAFDLGDFVTGVRNLGSGQVDPIDPVDPGPGGTVVGGAYEINNGGAFVVLSPPEQPLEVSQSNENALDRLPDLYQRYTFVVSDLVPADPPFDTFPACSIQYRHANPNGLYFDWYPAELVSLTRDSATNETTVVVDVPIGVIASFPTDGYFRFDTRWTDPSTGLPLEIPVTSFTGLANASTPPGIPLPSGCVWP